MCSDLSGPIFWADHTVIDTGHHRLSIGRSSWHHIGEWALSAGPLGPARPANACYRRASPMDRREGRFSTLRTRECARRGSQWAELI
jgi:hypothetical protein